MAAHIATAFRLRRALGPNGHCAARKLESRADAVVHRSGKIEHAIGAAATRENLAALKAAARGAGDRAVSRRAGMTELSLSDQHVLGLMPETGAARLLGDVPDPASANGVPRAELYFIVDEPAAYHARALAAGAREVSPLAARDWGHDASYALDPDGHVIAFARVR